MAPNATSKARARIDRQRATARHVRRKAWGREPVAAAGVAEEAPTPADPFKGLADLFSRGKKDLARRVLRGAP